MTSTFGLKEKRVCTQAREQKEQIRSCLDKLDIVFS